MSSVLDITISFGKCLIIRRGCVPVNRTSWAIGPIGQVLQFHMKIHTERDKIFETKPVTGLGLRAPYPTLSCWLVLTSIRSCQSLTYDEMITSRCSLKQKHGMNFPWSWSCSKTIWNQIPVSSYSPLSLRRTALGPSLCIRLKDMSVLFRVNYEGVKQRQGPTLCVCFTEVSVL